MKRSDYIYLSVILLLVCYALFFKPKEKDTIIKDNSQERIDHLAAENDALHDSVAFYKSKKDTVEKIKKEIQYVYKEKVKYIDRANLHSTDSFIRANISTGF